MRFARSDEELSEYFTSSLGVRAQALEGGGGGAFDPRRGDDALVATIARRELERHDAVAATLARTPVDHRRVLGLIYTPRSWPLAAASALSPAEGRGSLVALAVTLPRAAAALAKAHPGVEPGLAAVTRYVTGLGASSASLALLRRLRDEAETLRLAALAAYEALRVERVKAEGTARAEAKRRAEAERARRLDEELGAMRRRQAARFERRLRTAS